MITPGEQHEISELPGGPCGGQGSQKLRTPFEDNRDSSDGVFLEALDDLRSLVTIDAMDGAALDHLRRASQAVVQPELLLVLWGHAGKLLLYTFQHPDRGQVGLQDYI